MDDWWKGLPVPPPEEQEYIERATAKVWELMGGADKLQEFLLVSKLFFALGDDTMMGFILAMISYGYTLKDDEMTGEKHKFSIDDFIGDNK